MEKYNLIDLFAGCGGLLDGFMQSEKYLPIASVEWDFAAAKTLANRLSNKWGITQPSEKVLTFDIQRVDELFNGYSDEHYGHSKGLNNLINDLKIDVIVGGPPCQSYSVAGRVSDKKKMKDDYRNYLFEHYMKIVEKLQPKVFLLENVPGMLSAMPDGTPIIDLIKRDINEKGYDIIDDVRKFAIVDSSDYGVPQNRKRVILIGINKNLFPGNDIQKTISKFYLDILPRYKSSTKLTVYDAISDLPKCVPLYTNKKPSHTKPITDITWHYSRFHSLRDVKIFQMLAADIESGINKYSDSKELIAIYNEATGAKTKIHKYHVLKKDLPSTTILAHLYKDGLRFIHYDPTQARSITVREAARLQSFDDDFDFLGSQTDAFKMIGNAVPPKLALKLALALNDLLKEIEGG